LLRIIAGLEHPDQGEVLLDGEDATGLEVRDRRVGFVFQHYALFRHMTVTENVAFRSADEARAQRLPQAQIRQRVADLLARVQLEGFGDHRPRNCPEGSASGYALARALAVEPRLPPPARAFRRAGRAGPKRSPSLASRAARRR
jgi:sulfate transport system ATP-binding protein